MEIEKLPINDALLLKPKVFGDARGYFVETWQKERYEDMGINLPFVQDNHSSSIYGILRGLHFQKKHPQGKLISVSLGNIYDVIVDIRPGSATFGKWYGVYLNAENQHQLWVPPGMAHGFVVLSERVNFHYKCTDYYHNNDEGCIIWSDPELKIAWPIDSPILSHKDAQASTFKELKYA